MARCSLLEPGTAIASFTDGKYINKGGEIRAVVCRAELESAANCPLKGRAFPPNVRPEFRGLKFQETKRP